MLAITKQIHELHEALVDKNKAIDVELKRISETSQELADRAAHISSMEADLARREKAVKSIEDIVSLKKSTDSAVAQLQEDRESLEANKKAWISERSVQERLLDDKRLASAQEARNTEENRKALDLRVKKFDAEVFQKVGEIVKKMGIKV